MIPGSMRPTVAERHAAGKARRQTTPCSAHAGWVPPEDRPDPVALLREAHASRNRRAAPAALRTNVRITIFVLAGSRAPDGTRPEHDSDHRPTGSGQRRPAPGQLRRIWDSRTAVRLRHCRQLERLVLRAGEPCRFAYHAGTSSGPACVFCTCQPAPTISARSLSTSAQSP